MKSNVYTSFTEKLTNNCDGNHVGFGGSALIVRTMNIFGIKFVDFGEQMVEQCLQHGPPGQARSLVLNFLIIRPRNWFFDSLLVRFPHGAIGSAKWFANDMDMVFVQHVPISLRPPILIVHHFFWQITKLQKGSDYAFAFWVAMPYSTHFSILDLCAGCPTTETIAIFRNRKWTIPGEGT